jgi:hypothetical protein
MSGKNHTTVDGVRTITAHDGSKIRIHDLGGEVAIVFSDNEIYLKHGRGMDRTDIELSPWNILALVAALKKEGVAK